MCGCLVGTVELRNGACSWHALFTHAISAASFGNACLNRVKPFLGWGQCLISLGSLEETLHNTL